AGMAVPSGSWASASRTSSPLRPDSCPCSDRRPGSGRSDTVGGRIAYMGDTARTGQREGELPGLDTQFQALYTSSIIGILRADGERILDANDAFLAMVGYSREEMEAGELHWRLMTPPEYEERDTRALQELNAAGSCTPFEKEYIRKDGTRVPILIAATRL